jgi:hypothetical protein
VCPILIWVRVSYVGVRATVATACGAQSMMSPESGARWKTSPSIWQGTALIVANSTRLMWAWAPSPMGPSDRTISTGVIGVTLRGTERSSAIDPFRPFWPDRHQRRQLKHQPDRKSQPDQSKKASPLDPP